MNSAPAARYQHTAVWTGAQMIVWGGYNDDDPLNTGGRYNVSTNSWVSGGTSIANAPVSRQFHTAVWTGGEMIVWGGECDGFSMTSGGRYGAAPSGACLFCDDFEDGTLDGNWTYLKAAWTEGQGMLTGDPTGKKAIAIADLVFSGIGAGVVETRVSTTGGSGGRVWVLAWYQDKKNTMELMMNEESDKWIFKEKVNGVAAGKQKASLPILPNQFYDIRITYDGSQFQVFIDNSLAMTRNAATSHTGTIGFQVKESAAQFEEIQVN